MRPVPIVILVLGLIGAAVCVRLGFWQLGRWEDKKSFNDMRRAALEQPAVEIAAPLPELRDIEDRRVAVRGEYDASHQILLTGRGHEGEMGVHLVSPMRLANDSTAVLIERGWIPGIDVTRIRPSEFPAPGARVVTGVARAIARVEAGPPMRVAGNDAERVFSMRSLHHDSLAVRFPYPLAPYVVRESPAGEAGAPPIRLEPEFAEPGTNLSYAVQWFVFSVIILVGAAALAWTRRAPRSA